MKRKNIFRSALFLLAMGAMTSCSDFDEVNTNPLSTGADKIKPYYSLSASIIGAQQDPDVAERLFVINWAASARQDGEDGYGVSTGYSSDDYNNAAFSKMSDWLTKCYDAITLCNNEQSSWGEHEREFFPNILQMARIWRAYLLSEFADSFGPAPLNGFQGVNPNFSSEKDVYYYMLSELADAVDKLNLNITPTDTEAKNDPAYGFDAAKWRNYGISLRMRLAMRLSQCDPDKARQEFEAAVRQGAGITTADDAFRVQEYSGWDNWTGVMSRTWDLQMLSATMANLTTNLGGAATTDALATVVKDPSVYGDENGNYLQDADTYLGVKLDKHWSAYTDNPTKQYFFDKLPTKIDPRALVYYFLPGDYANRTTNGYMSSYFNSDNASARGPQVQICYRVENGTQVEEARVDATYSWNGLTAGWGNDEDASTNGLVNGSELGSWGYVGTYPSLADEYRNSQNKRLFFGPWETYFLKAEAALRGWNVGMSAEDAYYKGIELSFEYNGLSSLYNDYIESEDYNRVGTSVKWTHTDEPEPAVTMEYIDGYTKTKGTVTYKYPDASKILYSGHKLNDQLTKIITQLYIANTPWLPLENWSNHRRLGLPFFEIPTSTKSLTYMPAWTTTSWQNAQSPALFMQRMRYPTSLQNADAQGYAEAVSLLSTGTDNVLTPLWWAIGGHN